MCPWPKGKSPNRQLRQRRARALRGIKRSASTRLRLSAAHELGLQTAAKAAFAKIKKR